MADKSPEQLRPDAVAFIAAERERYREQLRAVDAASDHAKEWQAALARYRKAITASDKALASLEEARREFDTAHAELKQPAIDFQLSLLPGIAGLAGKKPDVQTMEEILRDRGPLHLRDIVVLGREQGITFKGTRPPQQVARDKLSSSKRFYCFGGNVWGLPKQVSSE